MSEAILFRNGDDHENIWEVVIQTILNKSGYSSSIEVLIKLKYFSRSNVVQMKSLAFVNAKKNDKCLAMSLDHLS